MKNYNCDGCGPHVGPETRRLPFPDGSAVILCRACYGREMHYRRGRNRDLAPENQFDLPAWDELDVYPEKEG